MESKQLSLLRSSLFEQGYIDHEQFNLIEELQDESNPDFVNDVVTSFFTDSSRLLANIDQTLEKNGPTDFRKLEAQMHQFKGSSSSIGAARIKSEIAAFRQFCDDKNREGCVRSFQQVKKEHAALKMKMDHYLKMERQVASKRRA